VRVVIIGLLGGALVSGVITVRNLRDLAATYGGANPELRRFMLYGPLTPMIAQVEARTAPTSSILLVTDADPALIAYGLFPRKFWQTTVDGALQPMFVPSSHPSYPQRVPESFAVDWVLLLTPENIVSGGDLWQGRGGR
jgi:hypothetical protein